MSRLEDNPAGLLRNFGDNLVERMGDELDGTNDLARQIVQAVLVIVLAAADTADAVEQQEENNGAN